MPKPKPTGWRIPRLTHRATAYAQIVLSVMFSVGYFTLLFDFARGNIHVPATMEDPFKMLLTFLTANLGQVIGFWFSRQRASEDPPKA